MLRKNNAHVKAMEQNTIKWDSLYIIKWEIDFFIILNLLYFKAGFISHCFIFCEVYRPPGINKKIDIDLSIINFTYIF